MKNRDGWNLELSEIDNAYLSESSETLSVTLSDHGGFAIPNKNKYPPPIKGDVALIYYEGGPGWGGRVRGFYVNGLQYFYTTKDQAEKERLDWLRDLQETRQKEYDKNIGDWVDRKKNLIGPLFSRIERFEQEEGFENFWKEMGSYELFIVEQAQKLYFYTVSMSDPIKWIDEWKELDYETQMNTPFGMDDGHSGNTFHSMVGIAKALHRGDTV